MNALTPRQKLILATAVLVALAATGAWAAGGAVAGARAALLVVAVAGCAWWLRRRANATSTQAPVARLAVVERAGLSPRCSVALVRADGREYLVAYGDGFAEIHATPAASVRFGRRPSRRRPSPSRTTGGRR